MKIPLFKLAKSTALKPVNPYGGGVQLLPFTSKAAFFKLSPTHIGLPPNLNFFA